MSYGILQCPEQDSNLHASQHSHLKRARLPFRHLGLLSASAAVDAALSVLLCKVTNFFLYKCTFSKFFLLILLWNVFLKFHSLRNLFKII